MFELILLIQSEIPLNFTRRYPLPEREITRNRGDLIAPYRTPAILGTVVAIDREFFLEIGSFDKGLDYWGGENVELSFRVRFSFFLLQQFMLEVFGIFFFS